MDSTPVVKIVQVSFTEVVNLVSVKSILQSYCVPFIFTKSV